MNMMNKLLRKLGVALCTVLLLGTVTAQAQWQLDGSQSSLNFVSIKNDAVGEVHSFASLAGSIGADGNTDLVIDLDSVETLIPIRNERMREMLFETVKFPQARVSARVDPGILAAVAKGGVVSTELPLELALHGVQGKMNANLVVVGEGEGRVRVFSAQPLLLNAADFGLEAGVAALREVAGLKGISNSVPVTLQLLFVPVQP